MIRRLLVIVAALMLIAPAAIASPTGVDFTASTATPAVGEVVTLTASDQIVCDYPPCRYQWRWFRTTSYDRLGTTVGEGTTVRYAFTSPGTRIVVLKVTNSNGTNGYQTASHYVTTH
jgi:hypothetical protein